MDYCAYVSIGDDESRYCNYHNSYVDCGTCRICEIGYFDENHEDLI
jgi:hypothetical protein